MHDSPPKQVAFIFVCQRGRLEAECVLLAASLLRHARGEFELIAAVPRGLGCGDPRPATLSALRRMSVRVEPIVNETLRGRPPWKGSDLLTNKIDCLRVPTGADRLVFLDSDQLCHREFYPHDLLRLPLAARRADWVSSLAFQEVWDAAFRAAGAAPPNLRIRVTGGGSAQTGPSVIYVPPSFNSSFVAVDAAVAVNFSRLWADCFRRIDRAGAMSEVAYFREQFSLAVAAHRSGLAYEMLDTERVNSQLTHYFSPARVRDDPRLSRLIRSLLDERPDVAAVVREGPEWAFAFGPASRSQPTPHSAPQPGGPPPIPVPRPLMAAPRDEIDDERRLRPPVPPGVDRPTGRLHYLLLSQSRTGSTVVSRMLGGHPRVVDYEEVFNGDPVDPDGRRMDRGGALRHWLGRVDRGKLGRPLLTDRFDELGDAPAGRILDEFVWHDGYADGVRAVGLKVIHHHLSPDDAFPHLRDRLRERLGGRRVIVMTRDNLLRQHLSWAVAERTGQWHLPENSERHPRPRVHLTVDGLTAAFRYLRRVERELNTLASHAANVMHLTYEEFTADTSRQWSRLQRFLGLPHEPPPEVRLAKTEDRTLREAIVNYDALKAHFAGTEWAGFFEE